MAAKVYTTKFIVKGSLSEQLRILKQREAIAALGAKMVQAMRRRIMRDVANIRRIVPSPVWHEDVIERGVPFPPGGASTLMVRCRGCEAFFPPQYVTTSGHCRECQHDGMTPYQLANLPKSSTIFDMGRLKKGATVRW